MNDTPESEPQTTGPTPGEILRKAREAKNLSVAAIATQMNLDLRTVDALEQGDQSRLPAPIFVRGYLRSFARLVGASEDAVLSAYQAHAPAEPAPRAINIPARRRSSVRIPAIPWKALFLILVLIGVVGLMIEFGPTLLARFMEPDRTDAPATLPLPTPGGAPVAGDAAGELSLPAPADSMSLALPTPTTAERSLPVVVDEVEPEIAAETEFAPQPQVETDRAPADIADLPIAPFVPYTAATVTTAVQLQLEFSFTDDSWVEIVGGDRQRLLYGLMRKGVSRTVAGVAPVSVLLGNAAAVELRVDGQSYDLSRYSRGKVARFTLDQN